MNLSRRILLVTEVLYLLCCSALIDAQEFYCGTEDGLSEKSDIPGCAVTSDYNILSYYSDIDDYIPDVYSRTIYVRVNFHIMQKADSSRNFNGSYQDDISFLNGIFNRMNYVYSNISAPIWNGPTGDPYITDSKIQFILKSINYHRDDVGWINDNNLYGGYCFDHYKTNEESELNIFFARRGDMEIISPDTYILYGLGWGMGSSTSNFVMLYDYYEHYIHSDNISFAIQQLGCHIAHEVGHCLSLEHTQNEDDLADTYFPECAHPWCSISSDLNCSNNLMGRGKLSENRYISPRQIGKMRKYLLTTWRSREVENNNMDTENIIISSNTTWDRPRVVFGDIIVEGGAVLTVKCQVYMPHNTTGSNVIVDGELIIDGGRFTNSTGLSWGEIIVQNEGRVKIINSSFEHAIRSQNGGKIEIMPGATVTLNHVACLNAYTNGFLFIRSGANITVLSSASILTSASGHLCIEPGAGILLQHSASSIVLNNGAIMGDEGDPYNSYLKGSAQILFSGAGYVDDKNQNVFINNTSYNYPPSEHVMIKKDVHINKGPGPFVVNPGTTLDIESTGEVIIYKNFEVKAGAGLEIK